MDNLNTKMLEIIDDIIDILPDDYAAAMTCLSVSIDTYAALKNFDQVDTWKAIYQIAQKVHSELGDLEV